MESIILALHVVLAVVIIVLVLMQQSKGSGMGVSMGSGASNTVFGSQGSFGFFAKLTSGSIALFFVSSLVLAWIAQQEFYGQASDVNQLLETIQENVTSGETLPGEQVITIPVESEQAETVPNNEEQTTTEEPVQLQLPDTQ